MGEAKQKPAVAPGFAPGVVKTKANLFYWIDAEGRVFRLLRGVRIRDAAVVANVQAIAKLPPPEPARIQLVSR